MSKLILGIFSIFICLLIGTFLILNSLELTTFKFKNVIINVLLMFISILSITNVFIQFMDKKYFFAFANVFFSIFWTYLLYRKCKDFFEK